MRLPLLLRPAAAMACLALAPLAAAEVPWVRDLDKAIEAAQEKDRLIFVDVYADWCGPCIMMERMTFSDGDVQTRLNDFVPLKIDADEQPEVAMRYGGTLPTLVVLNAHGEQIRVQPGFMGPGDLVRFLGEAEEQWTEVLGLESEIAENPDDAKLATQLASEYLVMGRTDAALALLERSEGHAADLDDDDRRRRQFALGVALVSEERHEEGADALRKFVRDFPDDRRVETARQVMAEAEYFAARALVDAGEFSAARERFATLAETGAFPELRREAASWLEQLTFLGEPAPALTVQAWIHGEPVRDWKQTRGDVALVYFSQKRCQGSAQARPYLEEIHEEFSDKGLRIIEVVVAFEHLDQQTPEHIRAHIDELAPDWPVAIDENMRDTLLRFGAGGTPWAVLVDREGRVRHGAFFNPDTLRERIAALTTETA